MLAAAGGVVRGLARGIDGEAYGGALDAGGQTVVVLGCGIDQLPGRCCLIGFAFQAEPGGLHFVLRV